MIRLAALTVLAMLLVPAQALASEVVVEAPGAPLTVEAGATANLSLRVSATGEMSCGTQRNNPATATLPGSYSLSSTGATPGPAGATLAFYRDQTAQPPPAGGCAPSWDTYPTPYSVTVPVSVAAGTPAGQYAIVVRSTLGGRSGSLTDTFPLVVQVNVIAPPAPAEVVVEGPATPPRVIQGQSTTFNLSVSAVGPIDCRADSSNPGLATVPTSLGLVKGQPTAEGTSAPLAFYRQGTPAPGQLSCPVTWDTAPVPYSVPVTVTADAFTQPGTYQLPPLFATIAGRPGALKDATPASVSITVDAAPAPPPAPGRIVPARKAPPPIENKTVDLYPLEGTVLIKAPSQSGQKKISKAVQVPAGTRVNVKEGAVKVVSDATGKGDGTVQSADFRNDSFKVAYTRAVTPGRRKRASRPITQLVITSKCIRGARVSSAEKRSEVFSSRRRKRRRGLFGKGKGRFRTRGNYGAATVVGTSWYSENRCGATFFETFSGVVTVRDFGLQRNVKVRKGQGYLAGPHHRNEGSSAG